LYYRKLVPFVYNQGPFGIFGAVKGIGFAVAGLFRPIVREPVSPSGLRLWAVKTTALACENLMLALRAKGYDSCPMEGMDSSRVRKILGLPARSTSIVMVIGAGQRKPEGVYGPQIRFDEKLFLHEH
jgi:nitroreductase